MSSLVKKHIDVITKYFYPVAAGIETNILETYSILVQMGWDVTIHTSQDTHTQKDHLAERELIRGLKVRRYSFKWYGYIPDINWKDTDVICLHNFNVVPHIFILFYGLILKFLRLKKFKLFLIPHGGYTPDWSIFSLPVGYLKKLYHLTIGRLLVNTTVDAIRAVSVWERVEIEKYGIKNKLIHVIPNGIENEAYEDVEKRASKEIKDKVKAFGNYIIQIGRIYFIKNYETAIRALSLVPNKVKYIIAGELDTATGSKKSSYIEELKNLIKKLNLEKRVVFVGVVRGIDKYYLIKHAQMMVHMARYESFCNVVHEGMSQGLPCIVANNTALPMLIKTDINGYRVETYDSKTLAERINYILTNKQSRLIQQMGETNRRYALLHSWKKVALKLDQLYR
ncbi:glycosyltransferase family 4 protein [Candidatus Roizmanbacteria bacterium]|nr:glycosyltransferase family 4 protein [Candidatus Roizmanbacteria bacterium]